MDNYKYIDFDLLNEIADGNKELIVDLVNMFTIQAPIYAQQLEELHSNQDLATFSRLAHKIKGSLSTLGIKDLAIQMKQIENNSKNGDFPENFSIFIEQFRRATSEAIDELNTILNRL
jgi:HPt (histidine-containing phosphotransfer) domain-containing protein